MPTSLPTAVREAWGEDAADEFSRWFEETLEQRTVHRDEFREVLSRLDVLEERFDHVEERFDHMEERFDHVEERFDRMEEHFNKRFEKVDERFERVDERFQQMSDQLDRMNGRILPMTRWIIGLIALFGTMVTVLLAVAQFGA